MCYMQLNQEEIMMSTLLIYGFSLFVLASTTTSNSVGDVEVRLLDNQNAPLMATLDMSKADERVKQFVNNAIETKMKNIEETMRSKQFVSDALEAKMKALEVIMKSQIAHFERNFSVQFTDYINKMVVKVDEENGAIEERFKLILIENRKPPSYNRKPPSYNRKPPSYNRKPPSFNRQPPSYNRKPPSYNRKPPSYNRKPPSYNRKPPSYNRKPPSYNRKPPSYNRKPPSYNRKAPSYNRKAPSYSRKAPSYN
ncbi:unnamed protein product [Mytilus coruscus]|uniref:Uncharacterized protein n=1 Tax=Mytilus coruscus TaxID=42192 RepID=A0A6J8CSB7_MYTCO|nr:unnamed protein product [Mytilus coruscus]